MSEQQGRNLVSEISAILAKHNHPNPNGWESKVNKDAFFHESENFRRFNINQFWRKALGVIDLTTNANTIGERFCLVEDGSTDDWLRLFDEQVAPTIVNYQIEFPKH